MLFLLMLGGAAQPTWAQYALTPYPREELRPFEPPAVNPGFNETHFKESPFPETAHPPVWHEPAGPISNVANPTSYFAQPPAGLDSSQSYQDAPGSAYQESLAPGVLSPPGTFIAPYTLDEYYRRGQFYDQPAIGPRAYADYAPSGYYPRDYQQGPGASLYERIEPPAPIDQEDFGRYVLRGPLPGSFIIPGTNTAMRLSGFVRMGANFDFDSIGTPDLFMPRAIEMDGESRQNMNFSARPTRLNLATWTPTSFNDWVVHSFVQLDFLSGNPPAGGSSNVPRLRLAFVDYGYFRIGQDATVFMDPSSFPRTADFQGPNGIINSRQGLVRITLPITERVHWAMAAEQPFSDISTFGQGTNVQDVPDFTSHVRYDADRVHFQASTVLRTLSYRETAGPLQRELGWGINLSGNFHPWAILMGTNPLRDESPSGLTRSRVILQYSTGSGIGRYLQDTSGIGMDGAIDAAGQFESLRISGFVAAYEHWITNQWMANLAYSNLQVDNTDAMPGDTFAESDYAALGLWFIPVVNVSFGTEILWGQRENIDGNTGRAERIQTVFQYNF